ncbi:MAG TPA: MFS transporter [Pseudobacteroides sp.]|uniref:MFS transporter n=1 Tax=Pseudobacteroides sp. TaxID=1968840 RepID=UPI002F937551
MKLTRLRKWLILINISISIFMATLDGSIVNIALPTMAEKFSSNISSIQWVVNAYLLAISVLLLVWGKMADIYGKKRIFMIGFIIFTVGSGLCGVSNSLLMLVIFRVIQAIGASSMMALSQGIVTSIFAPGERGKAFGITGSSVAIGSLAGPTLGGILVDSLGWHSIFLVNIPIGIIGILCTYFIIPEIKEEPDNKSFDILGALLFAGSILLLFMGFLFLQDQKISNVGFGLMIVASLVLMASFIIHEKRISYPLLDFSLFKIKLFLLGISTGFLSFISLNATIYFIPFYFEYVMKFSTLKAGILMSAYPLMTFIISPISGWLSDKISYRPLTIIGLSINVAVLFTISTFGTTTSTFVIVLLLALLGTGSAIFQSPNNSSVMGSVPKHQLGTAGGINALFRNLGMVSGTTISVILFSFTTHVNINKLTGEKADFQPEVFLKGFSVVFVFSACACIAALLLSVVRISLKRKKA